MAKHKKPSLVAFNIQRISAQLEGAADAQLVEELNALGFSYWKTPSGWHGALWQERVAHVSMKSAELKDLVALARCIAAGVYG